MTTTTMPVGSNWPQRKPVAVHIAGTKTDLPASLASFLGHAQMGGLDFTYFDDDEATLFPALESDYTDLSYEVCFLNLPTGFQNVRYASDPWIDAEPELSIDAQKLSADLVMPMLVNLFRTQINARGVQMIQASSLSRFATSAGHFCSNSLERVGKVFCAQPLIYGGNSARMKLMYYDRGVFLKETETLYQYFLPLRLPNQSTLFHAMTADTVKPTLQSWYNQLKSGSGSEPFFVAVDDIYGYDPLEILITTQAHLVLKG